MLSELLAWAALLSWLLELRLLPEDGEAPSLTLEDGWLQEVKQSANKMKEKDLNSDIGSPPYLYDNVFLFLKQDAFEFFLPAF